MSAFREILSIWEYSYARIDKIKYKIRSIEAQYDRQMRHRFQSVAVRGDVLLQSSLCDRQQMQKWHKRISTTQDSSKRGEMYCLQLAWKFLSAKLIWIQLFQYVIKWSLILWLRDVTFDVDSTCHVRVQSIAVPSWYEICYNDDKIIECFYCTISWNSFRCGEGNII